MSVNLSTVRHIVQKMVRSASLSTQSAPFTPPLQRSRQRTYQALVSAAVELIIARGYDAVSVAEITRTANYGRSTFYLYFRDKEDLVWKLLSEQMQVMDRYIIEQVTPLASPEREREAWRLIFASTEQARPFFVQMNGELSRRLRQMQKDHLIARFEQQVRDGFYSIGLDEPPQLVARFITGAILELLEYWLYHPELGDPQMMADRMVHLVFRLPPPERPPLLSGE